MKMWTVIAGVIVAALLSYSALVSIRRRTPNILWLGATVGKGIVGVLEDHYPSFRNVEPAERSSDPYVNKWLMPESERRKRAYKAVIIAASTMVFWAATLGFGLVLLTNPADVFVWAPAILATLAIVIGAFVIVGLRVAN